MLCVSPCHLNASMGIRLRMISGLRKGCEIVARHARVSMSQMMTVSASEILNQTALWVVELLLLKYTHVY